jgi:hypothetical protein
MSEKPNDPDSDDERYNRARAIAKFLRDDGWNVLPTRTWNIAADILEATTATIIASWSWLTSRRTRP